MTLLALKIPEIEIEGRIGQGSQSSVYLGRRNGQKVAIKVSAQAGAGQSKAFYREAAILASIRHPNLPSVLSVGESGGEPYLVMEYVEGGSLRDLLNRGTLTPDRVLVLARQLASALQEIHRRGLVHRDLKPENILLTPAQDAKVIDFGLAARLDRAGGASVIGTLAYCSPEQTGLLKSPIDHRSDLYSLGCVIYEVASGKLPFAGADLNELLRLQSTTRPVPLSSVAQGIGAAFASIVDRLLQRDPDDRYQSAHAVLKDLDSLQRADAEIIEESNLRKENLISSLIHCDSPLIGREVELDQLRAMLQKALGGRPDLVWIQGLPGMGKSRLIRELARDALERGVVFAAGKCRLQGSTSLGSIREAVEEAIEQIQDVEVLRVAAGPSLRIIRRVLPSLQRLFPDTPEVGETVDPEIFHRALADFIRALSRATSGLLLFIDDVQWIDESSFEVLKLVAAKSSDTKLLVVTASRMDPNQSAGLEKAADLLLESAPESLSQSLQAKLYTELGGLSSLTLLLQRLSIEGVRELVRWQLGGGEINGPFIEKIASLSEGVPLAVGEYLRSLLEEGLLRPSWGSWLVDLSGVERLDLPADVIQLILRRMDALDSETREVLAYASILGSPFEVDILALVLRRDVTQALNHALHLNLIEPGDAGSFLFVHDRVQEALIKIWTSRVQGESQAQAHDRIADVLDELPTKRKNEHELIFARARHYIEGTPRRNDQRAYEACLAAGIAALKTFSYKDSLKYLKGADEIADRSHLQVDQAYLKYNLAEALFQISEPYEAVVCLQNAIKYARTAIERGRFQLQIARGYASGYAHGSALDHVMLGLSEIDAQLPRSTVARVFGIAINMAMGNFLMRSGWGFGKARGEHRELLELRIKFYETGLMAAWHMNQPLRLVEFGARIPRAAHGLGPSPELVSSYMTLANVAASMKKPAEIKKNLRLANLLAAQLGSPVLVAKVKAESHNTWMLFGDHLAAEPIVTEALRNHRQWMEHKYFTLCSGPYAFSLLIRGCSREGLQVVNELWPKDERLIKFGPWLPTIKAAVLAQLGQAQEAADYIKRVDHEANRTSRDYFIKTAYCTYMTMFYLEMGELGEPFESIVSVYNDLKLNPKTAAAPFSFYWVALMYARIRLVHTYPEDKKRTADLEFACRCLRSTGLLIFRPHWEVGEAAILRAKGKKERAYQQLDRAMSSARHGKNPWAYFETQSLRARWLKSDGDFAGATMEANAAVDFANRQGWRSKARELEKQLDLSKGMSGASSIAASSTSSAKTSQTSAVTAGDWRSQQLKRQLDALMQVSLACSTVLDPSARARIILTEIIKIFSAERGFILVCPEDGGVLVPLVAHDHQGQPLASLEGYSTRVVKVVAEQRKPWVLTGNEESDVSSYESVAINQLRSIMAAPLLLKSQGGKDRLLGVVYLDSTLSRGIFGSEDLETLQALSNHIAVAFETARASQLEIERRAMQKDLELTGAVQSLLIPKKAEASFGDGDLAGYFRPAAQSGGDWWWFEQPMETNSNRVRILMRDVTGHGVASAMVTAAIASAYQSVRSMKTEMPQILQAIDNVLRTLCGEKYWMTFSAVELDSQSGQLHWWSAAAPWLLIARRGGGVSEISAPASTPLGNSAMKIAYQVVPFAVGDQLLLFTDGLSELKSSDGRMLGMRRLSKIFRTAAEEGSSGATRNSLQAQVDAMIGSREPADDVTFAVLGRRAG